MAQESSLLKLVTTCSLITEISRAVSVAFMVIIHEVTGTDDIFQPCFQDSLDLGTEKEDTREFQLLNTLPNGFDVELFAVRAQGRVLQQGDLLITTARKALRKTSPEN